MSDLLLGVILASDTVVSLYLGKLISGWQRRKQTYVGDMIFVQRPDGVRTFTLDLTDDPDLENMDEVVFKVRKPASWR
jgi:hypothetical protein